MKPRRLLPWIMAAGLAVRLAYAWHGHRAGNVPTVNDDYEPIAISLVERGEYAVVPGKPTSLKEPAYPLMIAATYAVAGRRPFLVLVEQCLLSMACVWLLWLAGRRLFGEAVAVLAAAVLAFYPQSVYYCAYFFRDTLLAFLTALLWYASLDWAAERGDPEGDFSAKLGGAAAAAIAVGSSALLPAVALAGLLVPAVAPAGTRARRFGLFLAPVLLAFGAWTARNWKVHHRFVPGSTKGGTEFLAALVVSPEDQATPRRTEILAAEPAFAEAAKLDEAGENAYLSAAAGAWIKAHPKLFLERAAEGYLKFWRLWPYKMWTYKESYRVLVAVSLLSDGWIIPLGFLGLWLFRARWREAPALPASILALTFVFGTVHAVIRYRLPLMGGMILLAAAAAVHVTERLWHPAGRDVI